MTSCRQKWLFLPSSERRNVETKYCFDKKLWFTKKLLFTLGRDRGGGLYCKTFWHNLSWTFFISDFEIFCSVWYLPPPPSCTFSNRQTFCTALGHSGYGSVGRVVTSDTLSPQFESSHWQIISWIYLQLTVEMAKINKKYNGYDPLKNFLHCLGWFVHVDWAPMTIAFENVI